MSIAKITTFYSLDQIFPKDQYNKNLDKAFILHYLIAYNKVKDAIEWIKRNSQFASSKEPKYQLTPLHVCVIVGDKDTAAALVALPEVSLTPQDKRKWTPLHHAVVGKDPNMITLLENAAKTKRFVFDSLKNNYGATYLDLKNMLTLPEYGEKTVFYYQEEGKIMPGTAKKFQEFTGTIYCKSLFATPQTLIENWVDSDKEACSFTETHLVNDLNLDPHGYSLRSLLAFRKKEPHVYLTRDPDVGCSLNALRDIQAGEFIDEYAGELTPPSKENTMNPNYFSECVAADKLANLASKVCDSFPNSRIFISSAIEGVFHKPAVLAISFIKKGDPITLDYGFDTPIKKGYHKELQQEKLQAFLKHFSRHWDRCKEINSRSFSPTSMEDMEIFSKMTYVFSTPHALFQVVFEKLFSEDEYKALMSDRKLLSQFDIRDHKTFDIDINAYFNFQKMYEALPEENQKILNQFIKEIKANLCGRFFIRCLINLVENKSLLTDATILHDLLFSKLYPELLTRSRTYNTIFSFALSIDELKQKEQEFIEQFSSLHYPLKVFLEMCINDCDAQSLPKHIQDKKKWLLAFRNSLL